MAGFQVAINGRFWVAAEVTGQLPTLNQMNFGGCPYNRLRA
jgi:hypothetical protein